MKKEKETWWYWLWVHLTRSGRDFDLSHNTTKKERKEISEKRNKRIKEYIYIIGFWSIVLILFALYIHIKSR